MSRLLHALQALEQRDPTAPAPTRRAPRLRAALERYAAYQPPTEVALPPLPQVLPCSAPEEPAPEPAEEIAQEAVREAVQEAPPQAAPPLAPLPRLARAKVKPRPVARNAEPSESTLVAEPSVALDFVQVEPVTMNFGALDAVMSLVVEAVADDAAAEVGAVEFYSHTEIAPPLLPPQEVLQVAAPEVAVQDIAPQVTPPAKVRPRRRVVTVPVAEEVAAVRDQILAQLAGEGPLAVAIAGVESQAGFEIAELAQSFVGHVEGEVLLVDATGKTCAVPTDEVGPGAAEWLLANATLETVVEASDTPGLDRVTCGGQGLDLHLVRSLDLERAMADCKSRYGLVLFDLGHANQPHVAAIARRCDALYLLVGLRETRRDAARATLRRLQASGVTSSGCILTAPPAA